MPEIVGVRFECAGKVYYFNPNGLDLNVRDWVVVETTQGLSLGQVVIPLRDSESRDLDDNLKPVLRIAHPHDLLLRSYHASREGRALQRCRDAVEELGLEMQVVKARYSFDGSRITFYFTADHRIDFRSLVRDLAHSFRTHVELRQLGPRDALKLQTGWGHCGRPLCCATWMTEFNPVSIHMAKAQDLPLNPENISGNCGRLCCCLRFEYDQYLNRKEPSRNAGGPQEKGI